MARYRLDSIAELARQLHFAPHETRARQVQAAEDLLLSIEPAKAYPYPFIVFRITGYHPRGVCPDLLTGLALQHDLGLLIEQVSDSLDALAAECPQPVLSIADVCARFNVTSKTIQRWRRKGLAARRFIFPDAKRRVGFLLGSVERFVAAHGEQVARGSNFSQVDDAERELILRRARRLAQGCDCCRGEIARRLAGKLDRSPLTILHTLRKHDQEYPEQAIFPGAPPELSFEERAAVMQGHAAGQSLLSLARQLGRTRQTIYRVVLDERIARLVERRIKFIDDPLYHQPDAEAVLLELARQEPLTDAAADEGSGRIPCDLPPYFAELYRVPLLSAARERGLFLLFNYRKFLFVHARRRLDPQSARACQVAALRQKLDAMTEVKNRIVAANLRLVVSVARKHLRPGLNLMELVSDGNLTLMRAVESFDPHRGTRFSTYATLALMKGFARSVPRMQSKTGVGWGDEQILEQLPDDRIEAIAARRLDREQLELLLSQLSGREREVLLSRFGCADRETTTFDELGSSLGLSRQRVRQIEQAALAKLRAVADPVCRVIKTN